METAFDAEVPASDLIDLNIVLVASRGIVEEALRR
jgi:hypothetical protein